MTVPQILYFRIRYAAGAFNTARVRGNSASSTMSSLAAAERLAQKLFGPAMQCVGHVATEASGAEIWRVDADPDIKAWCWASGVIGFGEVAPKGSAVFARGPDRALRAIVDVVARHAYPPNQGQLLVPGVPEAKTQKAGMDALLAFEEWCAKSNGAKDSYGVVFGRAARS